MVQDRLALTYAFPASKDEQSLLEAISSKAYGGPMIPANDAQDIPPYTPRTKDFALALLAMAQFVVVIDASIVNVALPSIGAHLHFARTDLSWVINAYVLAFGGFLLLGGRMADLLGRRRMFMTGLVLFSLASLAGGLAQSEGWLLGARAAQGLGAAIVSPAALSILTTTFADGVERNRALGVWGSVVGAGGAVGVLLGGILTSGLNWRWVLFVNVPIGIGAAILAPRILVESRAKNGATKLDLPGAATVTAGISLLVFSIVDAVNKGWGSSTTLLRLTGAVLLLAAFVIIERRARHPLMPFSIFRLRTLRGANIIGLLLGMSLFSMFFFISLYLQDVLHYSPIKTGIAYLPLAIGIILSAGAASRLATRVGFKPPLIAGLLLLTGGLLWFSRVPGTGGSYVADVLGPSILAGAGLGFSFVTVTVAAVIGTEPGEAGLASGLINDSQQIGGALGLAILATIANSRTQSLSHPAIHNASIALSKGYDRAFLVGAGFAVIGALLAGLLIASRESRKHSEQARAERRAVVPAAAS
jgi:EmrB/QacA subfamily drug resistance transporter